MHTVRGEQPFWFWNGNIDQSEVRRQIFAMKDGGAKGFFLHPRQGMELPYMAGEFIDAVKCAVRTAKEAGMEMWLYDEYPYPSGVSGGEVLENPAYRAHFLKSYCFSGSGEFREMLRWGNVLYAKAFPLNNGKTDWAHPVDLMGNIGIVYLRQIFQGGTGLSAYNRKRFFTGEHGKKLVWNAPEGEWKVYIFIDHEMDDFKYFGCFVDPLNRDAIAHYIATTHEKYKTAFGEEFGRTVRGIFTDETAPMGEDGILWSRLMPLLFWKRNGYDLIERLPALLHDMDIDNEKFLYDYNATVYEAFVEAYDRPIRRWCEENNLIYTGEKPHLRVEQCAEMRLPGTDNGHLKCGKTPTMFPSHYRANAKAVASSAHFFSGNETLCEAYHSLGWDATLRDMRWTVDWLGVDGVNFFVPHAFYYSEDALRKHDAPPSMFENMPWWKYNPVYTAHMETTTRITRYGRRAVKLLVIDPMFTYWAKRTGAGWGETPLSRLQRALTREHVDYYIVDRNLLREAAFEDGGILLRGEKFTGVALADMAYVEEESRAFLTAASGAGVKLFAFGDTPARCLTDGAAYRIPGDVVQKSDADELARAIAGELGRAVSVARNGEESDSIPASVFELDGVKYIYSVNIYKDIASVRISVPSEDAPVSVIDTVTGKRTAVSAEYADGCLAWDFAYAPFAPALFAVGLPGEEVTPVEKKIELDTAKLYPVKLKNRNLLRMGRWDADFGTCCGTVEPMPAIDQLVSISGNIPVKEESDFGCVKQLVFPEMKITYRYRFRMETESEVLFAAEPHAVMGKSDIFVNGKRITDALRPGRVYSRENLSSDVTEYLVPGENEILVAVDAKQDHDGLVNALYLAGDFGCRYEDGMWTLADAPKEAPIEGYQACGLPFYAGELEYDISGCGEGDAEISVPGWTFENAAELIQNGASLGARAWNPYSWRANIRPGDSLVLSVATTLLGAYEGAEFDVEKHETHFHP